MPRHNIFHNLHNITCGQHIVHSQVLGTVLDYHIGQVLVLGLGLGLAGQVLVNITDSCESFDRVRLRWVIWRSLPEPNEFVEF